MSKMKSNFEDLNKIVKDASGVFKKDYPKGRDPRRITDLLAILKVYWFMHPDLRLSQIIYNLLPEGTTDTYHIEDDYLIEELRKVVNEETKDGKFTY